MKERQDIPLGQDIICVMEVKGECRKGRMYCTFRARIHIYSALCESEVRKGNWVRYCQEQVRYVVHLVWEGRN
jgi:hypothetical protein